MWVFYMFSLPLTMGMVMLTLRYFAGPDVPRYVIFLVGYTWFSSISIIILVPADIWSVAVVNTGKNVDINPTGERKTISGQDLRGIYIFWSFSYWSTFLLTWAVVPIIQGYEDAGDFTVTERLKTSLRANLFFHMCVGSIALVGLILLVIFRTEWNGGILGFAMACSNTFGLVTGAFLLGFGLSEIPKGLWRNAEWTNRQKVLSHNVAKMAVKFDDAHQEFSNAIVVTQATSKQMSRRDPLRPYMNVIDKMLLKMLKEDPTFKPQGGKLGENDMDYDTNDKTMAELRRHLRRARERYYRYKSEYINFVTEAIELEDTIKNYEQRDFTGWKYVSSIRTRRSGNFGSFLDTIELIWRCILEKLLEKLFSVTLGCMSAAILLAEATILPSGVDLSLFSILINVVHKHEVLVQGYAFTPLVYMCVCTYYSLFKFGMLTFFSFTPRQTSSVSLLKICGQVARYAAPISYNFLNLIRLPHDAKDSRTVFEKRMGNIDDAVPFFGRRFNKIYPLIMVVYTMMISSNFFSRIVNYLGNWKIFSFQTEAAEDLDGFDPSGVIILNKERSWLQQGHKVGELVIPLARNFYDTSTDLESASKNTEDGNNHAKENKYTAVRTHQTLEEINSSSSQNMSSPEPLNDAGDTQNVMSSSRVAATWESMKTGFQYFKANIGAKKFLPLLESTENNPQESQVPSKSESLDEIFENLKRPAREHKKYISDDDIDLDDYGVDIKKPILSR